MTVSGIDVIKILCCFFLPPVAVGLEKGWCGAEFWLNVVLTILGWLPGQIHACCVVLIKDDKDKKDESQPASAQPATVEQPKTSEAPKESAKPAETTKPAEAAKPVEEAKASEAAKQAKSS